MSDLKTRYPISFQTVDVVVINHENNMMLLGRKPTESQFRLIGGFVDPKDLSLEYAAARELSEEAGATLSCHIPKYLFSYRVNDDRYRDSENKILTAVFLADYMFGYATPSDDIKDAEWYSVAYVKKYYNKGHNDTGLIVNAHKPIIEKLISLGVI